MKRPAAKAAKNILISNSYAVVAVLAACVLYGGIGWDHQYVFTPEGMKDVAFRAIADARENSANGVANSTTVVENVVAGLRAKYGSYIFESPQWMFNNAGGAMGAMLVLHCSLSEYVIIFGSALGTEGHSGRFLADDYFTIVHGEQWAFEAGRLEKEIYRPGDQHLMPRGVAKQYRLLEGSWALEYARGNILSMLPFGLIEVLTSTMDFVTLFQTISISARGAIENLLKGKI